MTGSGGLRSGFKRWRKNLFWWFRITFARQRARWREPLLFNAAYKRRAWQSSTRANDPRFAAERGTNGRVGGRSCFATRREAQPWWMVKLTADWPIHSIRIHDRRGRITPQIAHLQVSVSPDKKRWTVVYSDRHHFGDAASAGPLVIPLPNAHGGRFVKLELPHGGALFFNQVEVMVAREHRAMQRASRRYGFDFGRMTSLRMPPHVKPYSVQNLPRWFNGRLEAFHINAAQGRFGNNLNQIGTAVSIARHLGIRRVYLTKLQRLEIDRPIEFRGVTVLPDSALARDKPKGVLCGPFFYNAVFSRTLKGVSYRDIAEAARAVGQQIFHRQAAPATFVPDATDLAIHLRAGDIFARQQPHQNYTQPPLAFYRLCVEFARANLGIRRVVLVYEDEGNPCVGALKAHLDEIGLPFLSHTRTLDEDLAVLLAAQHCVFGRGSFGLAVTALSTNLRTVFYSWLEPNFRVMSEAAKVRKVSVEDVAKGYTRRGHWRNTPEQKQLMLDYPIGNLRLKAD
ncbi:MAG TPA: discoidin domain-containing protein [Dongiaceae bacterium]|jgi:hypothetical protein|nr:discoidin domain-containing protein [Dongiaceae bacterium]